MGITSNAILKVKKVFETELSVLDVCRIVGYIAVIRVSSEVKVLTDMCVCWTTRQHRMPGVWLEFGTARACKRDRISKQLSFTKEQRLSYTAAR